VTGNWPRTHPLQKPRDAEVCGCSWPAPTNPPKCPRTADVSYGPTCVSRHHKDEIAHLITDSSRLLKAAFHCRFLPNTLSTPPPPHPPRQSCGRCSRRVAVRRKGLCSRGWCLTNPDKDIRLPPPPRHLSTDAVIKRSTDSELFAYGPAMATPSGCHRQSANLALFMQSHVPLPPPVHPIMSQVNPFQMFTSHLSPALMLPNHTRLSTLSYFRSQPTEFHLRPNTWMASK
jgi:hypothetical protein